MAEDSEDFRQELTNGIAKSRRYAGYFDWPDKTIKERGIAEDFVPAYVLLTGVSVKIVGLGDDPPDVILMSDRGEKLALELTELVDQKIAEKGQYTNVALLADWPDEKLRKQICKILARKDSKLGSLDRGLYPLCLLVIHTDETLLTPERLQRVLNPPIQTRNIDGAFVLFSYEPHTQACPLAQISVARSTCS
jgi:hypothetical protein